MDKYAKAFRQFFQGEDGQLSMMRLLNFLSFFPASYISVKIGTENALTIYVATYALSYIGSKGLDVVGKVKSTPNINVEKADVTVESPA